jgi:membrane-bound lytic murein transglycosylase MltF
MALLRIWVIVTAAVLTGCMASVPTQHEPSPTPKSSEDANFRSLPISSKVLTGDFDQMLEVRTIRVLISYSRTLYFNDKGRERGITADTVRDFERWINRKYAEQLAKRPLTVFIIPTTRDSLLPDLIKGRGDIAAGNLTATDERKKLVDFVTISATIGKISEVLVTGPKTPSISGIDDLAGKTVHVRKSSSYYESLVALSKRLKSSGKPALNIAIVPDALEDEDMMEMVNAGLLKAIVVDDWKANLWAKILPQLKVRSDIKLREQGTIGWAIRKSSPKLETALRDFEANNIAKMGVVEKRLADYMNRIKQLRDSTDSEDWKRFEQTLALFEKYGRKYRFDPLMLAAQGYQESGLNQSAKSPSGAIGIMQIMPKTGSEMAVGDIRIKEPNIHAGAKYMDHLMAQYFSDGDFSEVDRTLFAFASYNCGPGNVLKMRKLAGQRGLDPNKWFNHVEVVTAEKIGMETTTYVRNIYKYYTAYKLMMDTMAKQQDARESVEKQAK